MMLDALYSNDGVNVILFYIINGLQSPLFQKCMLFASIIGKYTMFPLYLAAIAAYAWKTGRNVKQILFPIIIAYIVYALWVTGLKHLLHMPRPFVILPHGTVFITNSIRNAESPYASLPSGHAAYTMTLLVSLWPLLGRTVRSLGILFVMWVGISRIALGVHFPSDILISWVLAIIITGFTLHITDKLYKRS